MNQTAENAAPVTPPAAFQLGEFRIDPSSGELEGPGGREKLDPKVMDVFVELARHSGQVVLREDLLARLWPRVVVTDEVLSAIDLSAKGDAFKGQMLRLRKLVVQPGGVVRWHSHEARPANILVLEGSITEYSSNCKVPVVHAAGDVIAEFGAFSHWWKNTADKPAVLYSADLLPPAADDQTM